MSRFELWQPTWVDFLTRLDKSDFRLLGSKNAYGLTKLKIRFTKFVRNQLVLFCIWKKHEPPIGDVWRAQKKRIKGRGENIRFNSVVKIAFVVRSRKFWIETVIHWVPGAGAIGLMPPGPPPIPGRIIFWNIIGPPGPCKEQCIKTIF